MKDNYINNQKLYNKIIKLRNDGHDIYTICKHLKIKQDRLYKIIKQFD